MSAETSTPHGTVSRYTNRRCRCASCREAMVDYLVAWRARQEPPAPGDPRHGKLSTYTNLRCRCDLCRAARLAYHHAWLARRKAGAR